MKEIEIISRAVIIENEKILVCKDKERPNYFLPGGHVEVGEFSDDALIREMEEELSLKINSPSLIGIIENFYKARGIKHQEINLIYSANCNDLKLESNEEHIDFFLFSKEQFKEKDVRPRKVKDALIKWQKDKEFFHIKTRD